MPLLISCLVLLWDKLRRQPLWLLLLALLLLARFHSKPQLDREAIRSARTSGYILLAQREGTEGSRLESIDASSGDSKTIREEKAAWLYTPTWSSDGSAFAVSRIEHARAAIDIYRRDGRSRRSLTVSAWPWLAWRPHASQLAVANSLHNDEDGVHLLDLSSKQWEPLIRGGHQVWLSWSPDGTQLAYSRLEEPRYVYVFDVPQKRERRLCAGVMGTWSPSGKWLAVVTQERDGVEIVDASNGRRTRLISRFAVGRVECSPDGQYILTDDVTADRPGLFLLGVGKATLTRIGVPGGLVHGYSWTR